MAKTDDKIELSELQQKQLESLSDKVDAFSFSIERLSISMYEAKKGYWGFINELYPELSEFQCKIEGNKTITVLQKHK